MSYGLDEGVGDGAGDAVGEEDADALGLSAGDVDAIGLGDGLSDGTGDGLAAGTSARSGGASLTTLVSTGPALSKLSVIVPWALGEIGW